MERKEKVSKLFRDGWENWRHLNILRSGVPNSDKQNLPLPSEDRITTRCVYDFECID